MLVLGVDIVFPAGCSGSWDIDVGWGLYLGFWGDNQALGDYIWIMSYQLFM